MNAFLFFEDKCQKQSLPDQKQLHYHQQLKGLKAYHSSLVPPREDKTTPRENNITEITAETTEIFIETSPATKGWTIENTITAIPKLINPLPSSLRPLNQFITN